MASGRYCPRIVAAPAVLEPAAPPGARHEPALDGLRALAVAAVLAFHAGFGWARGGFLGVSAFFTLSGFLITRLLLDEHARTGRIEVRAFWARRFRRLLPAALLALFAIALAAGALASADQLARLRGDVVAGLLQVANWHFVREGREYAALFSGPSPVLHFWSLAIEAQCYVVVPLVVAVALRRREGRRGATVLLVAFVALAAAGLIAGMVVAPATAYYSTAARAPELLVGAVLAVVVRLTDRLRVPSPVAVGALTALVWSWSVVAVGDERLVRGGFVLHALVAAIVLAGVAGGGPLARLLGVAPLAWIGRVSYGIYLFHWPIFLWLTPERAGFSGLPLVAAQVALTVVLAGASFRLLEQPVRRVRRVVGLPPAVAVAAVGAVVVALVTAVTAGAPAARPAFADGVAAAEAGEGEGEFSLEGPSPPGVPRIAIFGDSTALRTGFGLPLWGIQTGRLATVADETVIGCSLGRGGWIDATGTARPVLDGCDDWPERWRRRAAELDLDGALVQIGPWDVADRRIPGDDEWRHIGDPVYDAFLKSEMHEAVDALTSSGAVVLWLTSPRVEMERSVVPRPSRSFPASEPARMDRLNELIREVAAERPDEVWVIDVAAHLRAGTGGEMDPAIRPDGVHVSEEASGPLAQWLAPAILAALDDVTADR